MSAPPAPSLQVQIINYLYDLGADSDAHHSTHQAWSEWVTNLPQLMTPQYPEELVAAAVAKLRNRDLVATSTAATPTGPETLVRLHRPHLARAVSPVLVTLAGAAPQHLTQAEILKAMQPYPVPLSLLRRVVKYLQDYGAVASLNPPAVASTASTGRPPTLYRLTARAPELFGEFY